MKKFLSILLTLFIIFCALPFTASADTTSGTTGNCIWILDGTVLTISGSGAMADHSWYEPAPWGTSITEVIIEYGVTRIGEAAFLYCFDLTNVSIPNSVTSIGSGAFQNCHRLTYISIPYSVTSISDYAFYGCLELNNITIHNNITNFAYSAFGDTGYYNNPENWVDGVLYVGNYLIKTNDSLSKSYTIREGTVAIILGAFSHRSNLTNITISKSIRYIEIGAFACCDNLTDAFYKGNETEWATIINEGLIDVNIHYNYNPDESAKEQTAFGDIDGDGNISATDALLVLQYSVGKITKFPVEQ